MTAAIARKQRNSLPKPLSVGSVVDALSNADSFRQIY
jgi:hypothetical protein